MLIRHNHLNRGWYSECILSLFLMLVLTQFLGAISANDLMQLVRTRDSSISDYSVSTKHISFNISTNEYTKAKDLINSLADKQFVEGEDTLHIVEELLKKVDPDRSFQWQESKHLQSGDRFMSRNFWGNETTIHSYDGQQYMLYNPDAEDHQLDIYPEIQAFKLWDFEALNITLKRLLEFPPASIHNEENATRLTIITSKEWNIKVHLKFDEEATLKHIYSEHEIAEFFVDKWFLFHRKAGDYPVPRIIVSLHKKSNKYCKINCLVIEDLKINAGISEKDLKIQDVPLWATVVDHHHDPPKISNVIDSQRIILRDEVMLDDLEITEEPALKNNRKSQGEKTTLDLQLSSPNQMRESKLTVVKDLPSNKFNEEGLDNKNLKVMLAILFAFLGAALVLFYILFNRRKKIQS